MIRERDQDDGRAFRISLTARAKSLRPVAEEILRELDQIVLATLGERQRAVFDSQHQSLNREFANIAAAFAR